MGAARLEAADDGLLLVGNVLKEDRGVLGRVNVLGEGEGALAGVDGPLVAVGGVLPAHGEEAALADLLAVEAEVLGREGDVGDGDVLGDVVAAVVAVQLGGHVDAADARVMTERIRGNIFKGVMCSEGLESRRDDAVVV